MEIVKWLVISLVLIATIFIPDIRIQFFAILCVLSITIYVLLQTSKGKLILLFLREARIELRKVIWPTLQETFYITLIVAIVSVITSLILWILDSILVRLLLFISSLRLENV